jgi:hypothetical protein
VGKSCGTVSIGGDRLVVDVVHWRSISVSTGTCSLDTRFY